MSYSEAIQYLYDLQFFGMKLGLENVRRLAPSWAILNPGCASSMWRATNGKGSTCAMLESIYRAAGRAWGFSPRRT